MKFTEFNLHEDVLKGIKQAQFETAMPVQQQVFAHSLKQKDVLVQSQTGSGKTAAFLITILDQYMKSEKPVKALIIVPTRELADQIEDDARLLSSGISTMNIATFFGGMGYQKQEKAVSEGVDLFIGTPGRLIDFQSQKKIDFKALDIVVIDEADRLFDMGFYPDIKKMLQKMRPAAQRQTMLFSATLSTRVRHLAWEFMNEPATVEIEPDTITVQDIKQELFHVPKDDKFKLLLKIINERNPETALIFTNTRHRAVEIAKRLQINGLESQFLMGDLPQRKRLSIINRMKERKLRFLVATDVAARGLHIDDLALVVNYDLPEDYENYVHRIGRTARAGKKGAAAAFACEQFVYGLEAIENYIGMKIPVSWYDGLDQVTDKSKDTPYHELKYRSKPDRGGASYPSRGKKRGSRSSSGEKGREKRVRPPRGGTDQKHTPQRPKGKQEHRKPDPRPKKGGRPKDAKPAAPGIQALPLEERIEIYKQKYGGSLEQQQPATKQDRGSAEKPKQPEVQQHTPKPKEKKRGLLARLFGKKQ